MAYKAQWQRVKIHRSYSVDEAARILGVHKATVRRWIKHKGLPALEDQKPTLILGRELKAYGQARRKPKQPHRLQEALCMGCKGPKCAAFGEGEIAHADAHSLNVRMLCEDCSRLMYKRFSWSKIALLGTQMRLTAPQEFRHLIETTQPCLNVHYEEDG